MLSLANYRNSPSVPGGPVLEFLDDPETVRDVTVLRDLLQRFGPVPLHDPTPEELHRLATLRDALVRIAEIVASGRLPSSSELDELNGFLAAAPVEIRIVAADGRLAAESTPVAAGWETIVRELAGWFADLLVRHEPRRVKRCADPACGRFFYDESKSRTRRWHDETCGNLTRVRRYRAARL